MNSRANKNTKKVANNINSNEKEKLKSSSELENTNKNINKERLKDSFAIEMFSEVIVKNPVLVSAIGLCPVVAICTSLQSALVLTLITYLTMIFSQVLSSLIYRRFEQWIRIALYSLSGMAIVAPVMLLLQKYAPNNFIALGLYLPLLVINPLITRQCERVAVKGTVKKAFVNAVSCATGYGIVLIITGFIREFLGSGSIWDYKIFNSPPLSSFTNPFAGFLILGFLAAILRLYFKKVDPQYAEELSVHSRSSIKKQKTRKQKSCATSLITEYEKNRIVAKKIEQDKVEKLDSNINEENQSIDERNQVVEQQKLDKLVETENTKFDPEQSSAKTDQKNSDNQSNKTDYNKDLKEEFSEELTAEADSDIKSKESTNPYKQEKTKPIDNEMINSILAEYNKKSPDDKRKVNKNKPEKKIVYSSEELEKLMSVSIEDLIEMSSKNAKAIADEKDVDLNKREVPEE